MNHYHNFMYRIPNDTYRYMRNIPAGTETLYNAMQRIAREERLPEGTLIYDKAMVHRVIIGESGERYLKWERNH